MKYLLLVLLFIGLNSRAQGITYNISTNNQIFNFNHKFTYSYYYYYDEDFGESGAKMAGNSKFLIEINEDGTGMMISLKHGEFIKKTEKILSCYEKTYRNSTTKYWKIKVEDTPLGINNEFKTSKYYYLDLKDNSFNELWIKSYDNTRIYYTN